MGIDRVLNFPFPTPPSPEKVVEAVQTLQILGALEPTQQSIMGRRAAAELVDGARITDLGRAMSVFPVSPRYEMAAIVAFSSVVPPRASADAAMLGVVQRRFAKMLAVGKQGDCLPYVVAIVAALSVGDPLVRPSMLYSEEDEEDEAADDEQKRALLQARQEKEQIDAEARQLEEALSEFSGKRQVSKQKQQLSAEAKKQRRLNAQVQQGTEWVLDGARHASIDQLIVHCGRAAHSAREMGGAVERHHYDPEGSRCVRVRASKRRLDILCQVLPAREGAPVLEVAACVAVDSLSIGTI